MDVRDGSGGCEGPLVPHLGEQQEQHTVRQTPPDLSEILQSQTCIRNNMRDKENEHLSVASVPEHGRAIHTHLVMCPAAPEVGLDGDVGRQGNRLLQGEVDGEPGVHVRRMRGRVDAQVHRPIPAPSTHAKHQLLTAGTEAPSLPTHLSKRQVMPKLLTQKK